MSASGTPTPRSALLGGAPAFSEPVYITRALVPDQTLFSELMAKICDARWFTNDGEVVRQLEARLQSHLGTAFCAAFCNGTTALQVALHSFDLQGEVITTPFTFPATVHAIEWCGLQPVFCDIDPETYNLDPAAAAAAVTNRTAALLPVHCFGNPCDVVAFDELAQTRGLHMVYDAAHAFGVEHRGRSIGSFGELSAFSFHATKVFHTAEGGAVVGPHLDLQPRIAMLRNFAIANEDEVRGIGTNGKMSEVHAAIGLAVFERANEEYRVRETLATRYRESLRETEGIRFQRLAEDTKHNYAYFAVEIDSEGFGLSRDDVHAALRAENIVGRKYFSPLCSQNPAYAALPSARPDNLPNARRLASRVLCLPLAGDLGLDGVDRIAETIRNIQALAPRIRRRLEAA